MRKLMVRVFLGKCLLIFSNIFMTSATEEDHTTIWESDSPHAFNYTYFNEKFVIPLDEELREIVTAKEVKRSIFDYNENENKSIGFIISSCKGAEIQWILNFKPENETSDEVINYSVQPETLTQYKGIETHIYVGKARRGRYYLELCSTKQRQTYFLYVTMNQMAVELLRGFKEKEHKLMTFKKNLRNLTLTLKWPEWSWRNEEIVYVVAWDTEKHITSGCEREIYMSYAEYITTKNRSIELSEGAVVPGSTYYVSVFVKLRHYNHFLIPYVQGQVTFPKSDPVALHDGFPIKKNFRPDDDKLTFRYKVRNRQFPGSENQIQWYVISCAPAIQIEINHRKESVLKKQLVNRYKAFEISKPKSGNRYVLKVTKYNGGSLTGGSEKDVEVFATMRSKQFPFPNVTDFNLKLFPNRNYHVGNKTAYTVAWYGASDMKKVQYCMRVYNKSDDERNESWQINQCTNMKKKLNGTGGFVFRNCTKSDDGSIITLAIYNLDPLTDYVVYVSARKPGSKRRLWYNPLHIPGNEFFPEQDFIRRRTQKLAAMNKNL